MSRRSRALALKSTVRPDTSGVKPTSPLAPGEPPRPQDAQLAPWPLIDRFPTILGSNLTFASIAAVMRLCQTGYRREYCDLLDELIEREPHTFAVVSQRILTVAGGRIELTPPVPEGHKQYKKAKELSDWAQEKVDGIADMAQAIAALQWGIYYGVSGSETSWQHEGGEWSPKRLHFLHSRRISYPDPASWRVRIWDQGLVRDWDNFAGPTMQTFGIAAEDYPGKFIIHTPQLRGNYPTRDGLGRVLVYWMGLKGMASRASGQYIERFAKLWAWIVFRTSDNNEGPRAADAQDLAKAEAVLRALGVGSMAGAAIPDSLELKLDGPGIKGSGRGLTPESFIKLCDNQISKAVLGQADTTDAGANGSRSAVETRKEGSRELFRYDAQCLADTLRRDLIFWIVQFNRPGDIDLLPRATIHVNEKPDPAEIVEVAAKAVNAGLPVDADELGKMLGLPLVPNESGTPRRMLPIALATATDARQWQQLDAGEIDDVIDQQNQQKADAAAALAQAPKPGEQPSDSKDDTQKASKAPHKAATPTKE